MNIYPGDSFYFVLPVFGPSGANPNVTAAPLITVIDLSTLNAVVTAAPMSLVTNTKKTYFYNWTTVSGNFVAIYSMTADGITYTDNFLTSIHVGDSRILGTVALDSTVAKDATVAKDSTVAKATDLAAVNPANATIIQQIKAQTDKIPVDPATETTLATINLGVTGLLSTEAGNFSLDKATDILTIFNDDGSIYRQFQLSDSSANTTRTKL
jgi:hypothetical protein